ncbi:MAG: cytidylate kinase-like family protein [Spirochaetales bacterium]|jgi:cytidylate kinase|nr:cytidylate kinase-like family protein [Spirochaetales bacterium]
MGVITISRKMGSAGSYIGRKAAEKLGLTYVDKHLIAKIMRENGFSQFEKVYNNKPNFWEKFDEQRLSTIEFLMQTIRAVGQVDNGVIVGRGGFGIFEDFSDVMNIRIKAPFCLRVERQMKEHGMTKNEAEAHVQKNDRVRRAFIESDFRLNYTNTQDFDLVLDTGIILPEQAIEWVSAAYSNLMEKGRCGTDKKVSDIKIDSVMCEHVKKMLSR